MARGDPDCSEAMRRRRRDTGCLLCTSNPEQTPNTHTAAKHTEKQEKGGAQPRHGSEATHPVQHTAEPLASLPEDKTNTRSAHPWKTALPDSAHQADQGEDLCVDGRHWTLHRAGSGGRRGRHWPATHWLRCRTGPGGCNMHVFHTSGSRCSPTCVRRQALSRLALQDTMHILLHVDRPTPHPSRPSGGAHDATAWDCQRHRSARGRTGRTPEDSRANEAA